MTRSFTYYNLDTGQIVGGGLSSDAGEGRAAYPGFVDSLRYYIPNGVVTQIPDRPMNRAEYDFDYASGSWQFNLAKTVELVEKTRAARFAFVDKVNPVWFSTLTEQQRQELTEYRQALLDITSQSGYPEFITWPAIPAWLL